MVTQPQTIVKDRERKPRKAITWVDWLDQLEHLALYADEQDQQRLEYLVEAVNTILASWEVLPQQPGVPKKDVEALRQYLYRKMGRGYFGLFG